MILKAWNGIRLGAWRKLLCTQSPDGIEEGQRGEKSLNEKKMASNHREHSLGIRANLVLKCLRIH